MCERERVCVRERPSTPHPERFAFGAQAKGSGDLALELVRCCEPSEEREFFIDNLLVQIRLIIVMIRWTGLAPWEFEFPFPGSLTSTSLTWEQTSVGSQASSFSLVPEHSSFDRTKDKLYTATFDTSEPLKPNTERFCLYSSTGVYIVLWGFV